MNFLNVAVLLVLAEQHQTLALGGKCKAVPGAHFVRGQLDFGLENGQLVDSVALNEDESQDIADAMHFEVVRGLQRAQFSELFILELEVGQTALGEYQEMFLVDRNRHPKPFEFPLEFALYGNRLVIE